MMFWFTIITGGFIIFICTLACYVFSGDEQEE